MQFRTAFQIVAAIILAPVLAFAQTTRDVCASGCTYTNFQTAINAAVCGDTVTLAAAETFTGNFVLTNTVACTGGQVITIRSNTADGSLPAAGQRITTGEGILANGRWGANGTVDYRPVLANVKAPVGGVPALRVDPGARDYVIKFIEVQPAPLGFGLLIELGVNTSAQRIVSQQPRNITIDRIVAYGDPIGGQKGGIDLNGANLTVMNSMIYGIAGLGQDATGVRGINGTGPYNITNNLIEGAAYSIIIGGDDPWLMTQALANAGATTTTATLSSFRAKDGTTQSGNDITTLHVGQRIAVLAGAGTRRHHPYVTACGTTTPGAACSSASITFTAIPEVPDTGALSDIRWGELPNGITIRRNHVVKRLDWMDPSPIVPAIGTVSGSPQTGTGTLAAGSYYYRVQPYNTDGYNGNNAYGTASTEINVSLSATGQINLDWSPVAGASHYRVYRGTVAGTPTGYFVVTTDSATDSGQGLTAATSVSNSSKWVVKNMFEMKFGLNWQIDSNIFEQTWKGSDIGYGTWWKSNNQANSCEFCESQNAVVERNIWRHTPGLINVLGRSRSGEGEPPPINGITFRNNLIEDSSIGWMQGSSSVYGIKIEPPAKNLTFDHNTWIHTMRGALMIDNNDTTQKIEGLVMTNSLYRRETYGFFCGGSQLQGNQCLNFWAPGHTVTANVIAGAAASSYPVGNLFPTITEFETLHFENYLPAGGDYSLKPESTWKGAGTDGADLGANIGLVLTATTGVIAGTPEGAPVVPPTITTVSLPNATQGTAYSTTLTATAGTPPYIWSVFSGSLPAGITLSGAGVLSGTPTVNGTFPFVARVTDSAGTPLTDDQSLSLVVQAPVITLNITTTTLPNGSVTVPYTQTLAVVGGTAPYSLAITSGGLPNGLTFTNGVISGIPIEATTASFTATVTDAGGGTDSQALSLTITPEIFACANRPVRFNFTEAVVYRRPTPPAAAQCPLIGDLWLDTSFNPPRPHIITRVTPSVLVEAIPTATTGGHALLSATHTDTTVEAPQGGSLVIGLDNGRWGTLAPGDGFLTQNGGTWSYSFNGAQLTNISEDALPATLTRTRMNADIFGTNTYIAFTAVADPGAPSGVTFARLFYDDATKKLRAWENGTVKDVITGATTNASLLTSGTVATARLGSGTANSTTFLRGDNTWQTVSAAAPSTVSVIAGSSGLSSTNVPAGGSELNNVTRYRFRHDTQNYTQVSMFGHITSACADDAGNANGITPEFRLEYWDGDSFEPAGTAVACMAAGLKDSIAFTTLAVGARAAGTIFRMYWTDGDGVGDPSVTNWMINFR